MAMFQSFCGPIRLLHIHGLLITHLVGRISCTIEFTTYRNPHALEFCFRTKSCGRSSHTRTLTRPTIRKKSWWTGSAWLLKPSLFWPQRPTSIETGEAPFLEEGPIKVTTTHVNPMILGIFC